MYTLQITAQNHTYPIYIGQGLLSDAALLNQYVKGKQVFVVTNETVAPLYLAKLQANFPEKEFQHIILPDGEQYKTLTVWSSILDAMIKHHYRRNATVIALGGGVIGDMSGFAAACYQRGIDFLQLPTTLLAQVDSSIGGKTAVNHALAKNMIGAFYPPRAVFIDIDTLQTLPQRELAAGYAEIIKHALIADEAFFIWLEEQGKNLLNLKPEILLSAIKRACEIKAAIVNRDEHEQGDRALLNFGHTFGHAVEAMTGYKHYLHGEAVAIGMVLACRLSEQKMNLPAMVTKRLIHLLSTLNLPVTLPDACGPQQLVTEMQYDKKASDAGLRFIVLKKLGAAAILQCDAMEILKGLK